MEESGRSSGLGGSGRSSGRADINPRHTLNDITSHLRTWYEEFSVDDSVPISHSSVGRVRDSLAELLRQMNGADAKSFSAAAPHGFVVVRHLHDEACMRLRSLSSCSALTGPRRTRSSKIQNNVVSLHATSCLEQSLPILVEMQPLARKSAATIATSHHKVIMDILRAAFSEDDAAPAATVAAPAATPLAINKYIVHVLVGDGIYTNNLAATILWTWMRRKVHGNYRLVNLVCATHAANLVVKVAAIGADAVGARRHATVTNCVRLFKFLIPEYGAEFVDRLTEYISASHDSILPPGPVSYQCMQDL